MTKEERIVTWFGDVMTEETDLRRNALYSLCKLGPVGLARAFSSLSFLESMWKKSEEEPTKDAAAFTALLARAEAAESAIRLIDWIYQEACVSVENDMSRHLDWLKDKIDEWRDNKVNLFSADYTLSPPDEEESTKGVSRPRVCFFCRHHVKEVTHPEYPDINPCSICWDGKSFSKFEIEKKEP